MADNLTRDLTHDLADFDLALIGGAGIAREAPGRGLRLLLVEQNDLASGTSSASTKLIHGGLRYLEHGWFRLVREALVEREVMLRMAPHLIRPMRFVLRHEPRVSVSLCLCVAVRARALPRWIDKAPGPPARLCARTRRSCRQSAVPHGLWR